MLNRRASVAIRAGVVLWACAGLVPCAAAKTDQTVVQQFATLLGSGTYARIAWTKGGSNVWGNLETYGGPYQTAIYVCDTKDGVRRPLTAVQPTGHLVNATFTADGARVAFTNGNTLEVYVCDFRGTNLRKLVSGFISFRTWRDPGSGSDWVIVSGDSGIYRVNIDAPNVRVPLLDEPYFVPGDSAYWTAQGNYLSLSPNGYYLAGGFPTYGSVGAMAVPNGEVDSFVPNGCWTSFSRNDNNKIMYTIQPHTNIRIVDVNGNEVFNKNIATSILPHNYYNSLRWSNDDDIISHWNGGTDIRRPPDPNMPIVQRISTTSWVSLYDDATDFNANTDVFVYTGSIPDTSDAYVDTSSVDTTGVNQPPTVSAGRDTVFKLSQTQAFFLRCAINDDGKRLRQPEVQWSLLSGPDTGIISSPQTQYTSVGFDTTGTYTFRVQVFDGEYTAADTVVVFVQGSLPLRVLTPAAGAVVNAGSDFTVTWEIDPAEAMVVYLTTDAGMTWEELTQEPVGMTYPLQFVWSVDPTLNSSTTCQIRVESYVLHSQLSALSGQFTIIGNSGTIPRSATLHAAAGVVRIAGMDRPLFSGLRENEGTLRIVDGSGRHLATCPVVKGVAAWDVRRAAEGVYVAEFRDTRGNARRSAFVLAR